MELKKKDLKSCLKFVVFFGVVSSVMIVIGYGSSYAELGDAHHSSSPVPSKMVPLTIHTNPGRLGNQMFTFATLYGLSSLNGRIMVVMQNNHDVLAEYFDINYPLVNPVSYTEVNPWKIGNWLKVADKKIPLNSNIVKGNVYPNSFTFFHHCRQKIRELFTFNAAYRAHAQRVLSQVKRVKPWTQVFVGVHVRRGDYLGNGWLRKREGREVEDEYFEKAVKHFTDKYDNVAFVAVSDDREWCRRNLSHHGILTTPDSPSAGHDLALLVECNHTIMTYGTYGFWGGYLSGGEVVYFDDFLRPNRKYTRNYFLYAKMYPADWIGISTTKPGFWESYTNPFDP